MYAMRQTWRLLFPWATPDQKPRGWLIAHAVLWAALFASAWWLGALAGFDAKLAFPWPWLNACWLPLLVLLLYGAGGSFAGLQRQAEAGSVRHAFADIEETWNEALAALRQAQLDPAYLPIFLILGKPAHGVKALWESSSLHVAVAPGPETPFCVTASRGAIFIWCGNLTRLGQPAHVAAPMAHHQLRRRFEALLLHLAELRRPYCPINGILAIMPYAAAETDASAEAAREQCQQDVEQVRAVLGVECPATLLVGGLDQDPGFCELLNRLNEADRWQALGQRFPLVPDVDPQDVTPLLSGGTAWFCRQRLPGLVYDHLHVDEAASAPNQRMVAWLAEMQERVERFGRWTAALAPRLPEAAPLVTGCFFAATGPGAAAQGCVGGVFKTLVEQQDHVAWAPAPLEREALYRRWTQWAVGSATLALVAAVVCATMFYLS